MERTPCKADQQTIYDSFSCSCKENEIMVLLLVTFTFDGKHSIYTVMENLLSGTNLCGQKATICLLCSLAYLGPLHQNHSSVSTLLWTTVTCFFYMIDGLTF